MPEDIPKAPEGISQEAQDFWAWAFENYDFTMDAVLLLRKVVKELTLLERLETELAGTETIKLGPRGSAVIDPRVTEIRLHTGLLATLLKALDLQPPEEESGQLRTPSGIRPPMTKAEAGRLGGAAGRGRASR